MMNLVSSKLVKVDKERDFLFINFLFSVAMAIVSVIIILIMLYDSNLPEFWRVGLGIILLLILMLFRSIISISFGSNIKRTNPALLSNKTIVSLSIVCIVDILFMIYFIFYYQIQESIPSSILEMILAPLIIIAVISLIFVGIENIVYSFGIGALTLSLFVNPSAVHHTMGEFILFYSIDSSLMLTSFYILPGLLLGMKFDNYIHIKDQGRQLRRIIVLAFVPLVIIFIFHFGLFFYVFTNWESL